MYEWICIVVKSPVQQMHAASVFLSLFIFNSSRERRDKLPADPPKTESQRLPGPIGRPEQTIYLGPKVTKNPPRKPILPGFTG